MLELEEQTDFGFSPAKRQDNVAKAKIADSFYRPINGTAINMPNNQTIFVFKLRLLSQTQVINSLLKTNHKQSTN